MRRIKGLRLGILLFAATALTLTLTGIGESGFPIQPAPTGFDGAPNGMVDAQTHSADQSVFQEVDTPATGLGSVFNGTSCAGCHLSGAIGGGSNTTELRAGHTDSSGNYVAPTVTLGDGTTQIADRSLIDHFAVCPDAQEPQNPPGETINALRMTVNTLGDGFVEAIPDSTLLGIARAQSLITNGTIHGQAVMVDVLEAPGTQRVGRFGWKDQQASLLSFAGDAYLNEQGITNRLFPEDVTEVCDSPDHSDPEDPTGTDGLADIDHFARFIRATKAPSIDPTIASTDAAQAGSLLFNVVGCNLCHVRNLITAAAGTAINGGTFTVPDALGSKVIHPFSDFLLHDVGTGDGIVQNGGQGTAYKLRTAPLWGLRMRTQFMHDGQSSTPADAILRHGGEASSVINRYRSLSDAQKAQLLKFLSSL